MGLPHLAQELAGLLADAVAAGAGRGGAPIWAALQRRFAGDTLAAATLTLFESEPASADMQRRLAGVLAAQCDDHELRAWTHTLRGGAVQVRAHISAGEDALIQGSGHKLLAPDGAADLRTSAAARGRIVDSPITIVGAGAALPSPRPIASAPTMRGALPPTLSADGAHFSYGHALIVGVGVYQRAGLCVPGATTATDARALAALLRDPQRAAYPEDQVQMLLDTQATRMAILAALETLAQRLLRAPGGTALIFFAGHGEPCGAGYALLPHDADPARLEESAIGAELFHRAVARVRAHARRLVVLLNCCHAGGVGDSVLGAGEPGAAPPPEFYRPLAAGSGQVVISSSRPAQKSAAQSGQDGAHTPFGAQLLGGLAGGAAGAGPGIGIFELFGYLRSHVPADAAATIYRGAPLRQEPLFYASQLDDNIAVALRPADTPATLGSGAQQAARLVALELAVEAGRATPGQLAERDALLAQIA